MKNYIIIGLVLLVVAACAPQPGSIPNTGDSQTPEAEGCLPRRGYKSSKAGTTPLTSSTEEVRR